MKLSQQASYNIDSWKLHLACLFICSVFQYYCQTRCLPILVHPWQNVYHWMLLSPVWLVVHIFYYFILASAWLTTVQFGLLNVNLNCLYIAHYSSYHYTFWWCHLYSVAKLICPYLISSCVGQYIKRTTVWKVEGWLWYPQSETTRVQVNLHLWCVAALLKQINN